MRKVMLILFMSFTLFSASCEDIEDLHGIWLNKGVYTQWQEGNDPEVLGTREIELAGEVYESVWINLAINLKESPPYFKHWGFKCIIEKIERHGETIRLNVHSFYNNNAQGVFDIKFLDNNSFLMTLISMDEKFANELENSWFTPDRLQPEQIYIRCPKKQSTKVGE